MSDRIVGDWPLSVGDATPFGEVEVVSYTAYFIAGEWIPFATVHGQPKIAEPLVEFQCPYSVHPCDSWLSRGGCRWPWTQCAQTGQFSITHKTITEEPQP